MAPRMPLSNETRQISPLLLLVLHDLHAAFDSRTIHSSCVTLLGDILHDAGKCGRQGEKVKMCGPRSYATSAAHTGRYGLPDADYPDYPDYPVRWGGEREG